jgi:hypothetical protein
MGYKPPVAVANLATEDTMNNYTRRMFYLNKPMLLPTVKSFRKYCPENASDIILGCYHTGQNGIFIYAVQDPTLAGVQQVTAAHEVLHAVYARLSNSARNKLNSELESYYKHGLNNPRVEQEIKLYQQTEPGAVFNEMSCTFGTEIANLPTALNNYYKQFFTNRQVIVHYEEQYQSEFTSRENIINQYDSRLSSLKQQINSATANISSLLNQINSENAILNSEANSNVVAYNNAVPGYNQLVNEYNNDVDTAKNLINSYNQLVGIRNKIAGELDTLDKALNTRLTTASIR